MCNVSEERRKIIRKKTAPQSRIHPLAAEHGKVLLSSDVVQCFPPLSNMYWFFLITCPNRWLSQPTSSSRETSDMLMLLCRKVSDGLVYPAGQRFDLFVAYEDLNVVQISVICIIPHHIRSQPCLLDRCPKQKEEELKCVKDRLALDLLLPRSDDATADLGKRVVRHAALSYQAVYTNLIMYDALCLTTLLVTSAVSTLPRGKVDQRESLPHMHFAFSAFHMGKWSRRYGGGYALFDRMQALIACTNFLGLRRGRVGKTLAR